MSDFPVVLDTETTGFSPADGHRIIEVAAARFCPKTGELLETFHRYVNPGMPIPERAIEIHGITDEMLADKPSFAEVADELADFVRGRQLVIHNAPFDLRFLNAEFEKAGRGVFDTLPAEIICSRRLARFVLPPHKSASLDTLCDQFGIDRSRRTLHGALIDIALLAQVYLKLVPLAAEREEAFAALLPFPKGAELPADKDALGRAYVRIGQVIKLLENEQERILKAIEPLLGGSDYEHRDFIAAFRSETRTQWDKIVKELLPGVDLSPYRKSFEPKLTIKAKTPKGATLPPLAAEQEKALAILLPFPRGEDLPADKDVLGRGYTTIEQLVGQLRAEQKRIRDAIRPLLGGENYSHPEFVATFSPNTRTEWEKVKRDLLKEVDLSKYQKTSQPELEIKAA